MKIMIVQHIWNLIDSGVDPLDAVLTTQQKFNLDETTMSSIVLKDKKLHKVVHKAAVEMRLIDSDEHDEHNEL